MSDFRRQTDDEFTWTAHPAAERPGHAMATAGVILAMAAVIWVTFSSPAWAIASVVVLVAALNRFFFPSRFSITNEGICAAYPLMRKRAQWKYLRRFNYDHNGGYLSTRARPSRLDAYRGMHLLFPARDASLREEAIRRLRQHMADNADESAAVDSAAAHATAPVRGKAAA